MNARTFSALTAPAFARVLRDARAWVAFVAWAALAGSTAVYAHRTGTVHPADEVLLDVVGPIVLPLLTYVLVGFILSSSSVASFTRPLVGFGAAPIAAALALVVAASATCAVAGGAVATLGDWLAHGDGDPPRIRDALASAYAGALGGAAYGAWFTCGGAFGRRGMGRPLALVLDWVAGANTTVLATLVPRGHLRNLLGGAPPCDLPERASAVAVLVIVLACAAVTSWCVRVPHGRAHRARRGARAANRPAAPAA